MTVCEVVDNVLDHLVVDEGVVEEAVLEERTGHQQMVPRGHF